MFFRRITILFYVTIILFVGSSILLFALNWLSFGDLYVLSHAFYHNPDLRMIVGIVGAVILITNFLFYRYFSVNVHRDKIIAFDNPSGRVSVSLMAMEDLVRRMIIKMSQVKDGRVKIKATKKGLDVKIRVIIKSETHIPELTSKIQDQVKRKIQDTIGLEEPVDVAIYVGKIIPERVRTKVVEETSDGNDDDKPSSPTVPFQGYRA